MINESLCHYGNNFVNNNLYLHSETKVLVKQKQFCNKKREIELNLTKKNFIELIRMSR